MARKDISVYISYLLRHRPQEIRLDMDNHGWVRVDALIDGINRTGKYTLDLPQLEEIVSRDSKGRYIFSPDRSKIKACQGHSLSWVEPELELLSPPEYLYHGTTADAVEKILQSGAISKMGRHAVHMQADPLKAWQSAVRWHRVPVVLKIDAAAMSAGGFVFGRTENGVWCTESVPAEYILERITRQEDLRGRTKVAFICVHNSCRSQIAEALGKHLAGDVFQSYSAGTETKPAINPDAVRIMKQLYGIDMEKTQYSKLLEQIPRPDVMISMGCNVSCPVIGRAFDDNWQLEDPTGKSDAEFREVIGRIEEKILQLKEKYS